MAHRIVGWLKAHDPEGNAGHKAIKVAVAVTTGVVIGTVLGNAQMTLFASFGGIAILVFADFPGTRGARLGAYVGLYVVGLLLIALGTVMSPVAWLAVAGMAVVGFVILFSGVLSAALAGASRAALLAFILPVMVPVPMAEIPARWAGWTLASLLAVPMAVFLWPPRDHQRLRTAAAAACSALADQLAAWSAGVDAAALRGAHETAGTAIVELRAQFRRSNVRPVGLTAGSRQLMRLPDRLEWLHTVVDRLPTAPVRTDLQRRVADACVTTLRAAQGVLVQAPATPTDASRDELAGRLRDLQHLHVASRTFARLVNGDPFPHGDDVHPATKLELVYTTRLTGLTVAASAAADARSLIDRLLGRNAPATPTGEVLPVRRALTGHLNVRSVWFQNSVRGAIGLALAVTIAEVTEVAHGFWVVLGAMSVLRTTALTTGSTALRALGGTLIGFVAGAVIMLAVGTTPWHLWVLLPITLLVAGYLPEAVSFVAGQAAFTVLVVVLFNIISPSGWGVGLVRVEDVLFGCASALISGVLLWPRGAAAQIRRAVAEFYRSAADAVVAATGRLAGAAPAGPDGLRDASAVGVALGRAAEASLRLDDALREYLFERGTRNVPLEALTSLSNGAVRTRMTAEAIAELPPTASPPLEPAAHAVAASAEATRGWFDRLAERLERASPRPTDPAPPLLDPAEPVAEPAVVADVRQVLDSDDDPATRQRLLADGHNLWMAALYVDNLVWLQRRLPGPATELIGRSAGPPSTATDQGIESTGAGAPTVTGTSAGTGTSAATGAPAGTEASAPEEPDASKTAGR
ncbi:FUSC family protein [Nakamurella sp.]|uniref:FUSC family protein n=1 Tax=Nakamurella sp. TaxID=1869182 RepID=UPI0037834F1A